jgi:hypothetical protein
MLSGRAKTAKEFIAIVANMANVPLHAADPERPPRAFVNRAMTPASKRHPMFGFLCAACGRCLEELPAWQLGAERFYCGIFCREADEEAAAREPRPDRKAARSHGSS